MFLKKVGSFLGATVGIGIGLVGGSIQAIGTIIEGGSLKEAEKNIDDAIKSCGDAGSEIGEEHFPTIAKGAAVLVGTIVAAAALAKTGESINNALAADNSSTKNKKNQLLLGGAALTSGAIMLKNSEHQQQKRFTDKIINRKNT